LRFLCTFCNLEFRMSGNAEDRRLRPLAQRILPGSEPIAGEGRRGSKSGEFQIKAPCRTVRLRRTLASYALGAVTTTFFLVAAMHLTASSPPSSTSFNGNYWLMIEATGHQSNRDAIGTRVKVTTGSGRNIYNHLATSVGFMSSSDKRLHFGLGKETAIKSVEIVWPRGAVETLKDVPVDRILKVHEPTP